MTESERNMLDALRRLTEDGVSPTYEELRDALGLSSKSHVHRILHQLRGKGLVTWQPDRHRSLVVLADNPAYAAGALNALSTEALDTIIATASGIVAHRCGWAPTVQMLCRIGDRLNGRPGGPRA